MHKEYNYRKNHKKDYDVGYEMGVDAFANNIPLSRVNCHCDLEDVYRRLAYRVGVMEGWYEAQARVRRDEKENLKSNKK